MNFGNEIVVENILIKSAITLQQPKIGYIQLENFLTFFCLLIFSCLHEAKLSVYRLLYVVYLSERSRSCLSTTSFLSLSGVYIFNILPTRCLDIHLPLFPFVSARFFIPTFLHCVIEKFQVSYSESLSPFS